VRAWFGNLRRPASDIRVVTYNVQGGNALTSTAVGMIHLWEADILVFQECGGTLRAEIEALASSLSGSPDGSWSGDTRSGLCILSRFPIHGVEEMERPSTRKARPPSPV
jgi:exonuclease III